jgi:aspartyl-tRNA(Asn)/glutamyl-tRNA(Gln) amidotransferase subunit A
MSRDLLTMTASEMLEQFASGALSPVEAARAMLAQVRSLNERVNAFCLVDEETTLQLAGASEQRYRTGAPCGSLDGVPVAVKDVFLTPMWPTLRGSRVVDGAASLGKEASATRSLARHGYVPVGKTTTPEFGWKGVTDSPLTGVTRNPWNLEKTSGGSSGGSAAAVALGMAPLALGTDAGGSIRIPAGFCGIVGFKPTFGEVPHWPGSPFGTLAHAGPMARTVADCALMMNALTEADPRDPLAAPRRGVNYTAALDGTLDGLKIAFSTTLVYVDVQGEVAAAVAQAVRVLG